MKFDPVKFYREFPAGGDGYWLEKCLTAMCEAYVKRAGGEAEYIADRHAVIAMHLDHIDRLYIERQGLIRKTEGQK